MSATAPPPVPPRGLIGFLDALRDGVMVVGWASDPTDAAARPIIRLMRGVEVLAECGTDAPRDDGNPGFRLVSPTPLTPQDFLEGRVRIRAMLPGRQVATTLAMTRRMRAALEAEAGWEPTTETAPATARPAPPVASAVAPSVAPQPVAQQAAPSALPAASPAPAPTPAPVAAAPQRAVPPRPPPSASRARPLEAPPAEAPRPVQPQAAPPQAPPPPVPPEPAPARTPPVTSAPPTPAPAPAAPPPETSAPAPPKPASPASLVLPPAARPDAPGWVPAAPRATVAPPAPLPPAGPPPAPPRIDRVADAASVAPPVAVPASDLPMPLAAMLRFAEPLGAAGITTLHLLVPRRATVIGGLPLALLTPLEQAAAARPALAQGWLPLRHAFAHRPQPTVLWRPDGARLSVEGGLAVMETLLAALRACRPDAADALARIATILGRADLTTLPRRDVTETADEAAAPHPGAFFGVAVRETEAALDGGDLFYDMLPPRPIGEPAAGLEAWSAPTAPLPWRVLLLAAEGLGGSAGPAFPGWWLRHLAMECVFSEALATARPESVIEARPDLVLTLALEPG